MAKKKRSVLDHVFVPKARILSEEEAKELLKKYHVTKDMLPKILSTDPVAVELGAKPGDIIEFKRNSPIAGESVYYRVVIEK